MSTEIKLHCWISYAAGRGRFHDVRVIQNIGFTTFYKALHTVSEAINECSFLEFKFPQTPAECEEAANDFMSYNRGGAIHQCVGCIDVNSFKLNTTQGSLIRGELYHLRKFRE